MQKQIVNPLIGAQLKTPEDSEFVQLSIPGYLAKELEEKVESITYRLPGEDILRVRFFVTVGKEKLIEFLRANNTNE